MSKVAIQDATVDSVESTATSTTLFTASGQACGRAVYNDSASVLYLKFGATASITSYTTQIPAGGYYEFPAPVYGGRVDGLWSTANGDARTTEW